MPTRKVSERERLMLWARTADDAALEEAAEILRVEKRARASKPPKQETTKAKKKDEQARVPPGPPNPPKPANDNPQG